MNLDNTSEYINKIFNKMWVKWVHEGSIVAETSQTKTLNAYLGTTTKHCSTCLNLNGCCFVSDNMPPIPLHINCHCKTEQIDSVSVNSTCLISKFTDYLFDKLLAKSKKELFESWGFSILDADSLKKEFEKQANLAYVTGDYILGVLDSYGQRLSIKITLNRKDGKGQVTFISGWMVYPNGKILLTTPYGGK